MKPDWDKLMKNWNKGDRLKSTLIADVDCTADEGKPLCEQVGVQGFPTIKWGDPNALSDYDGGRDYEALKKWVKKNLKPMCSPTNLDLCSAEQKADIDKYDALTDDDLAEQIIAKQQEIEDAEAEFKQKMEELQARYKEMDAEKTAKIAAVKESGLSTMLGVQAKKKKTAKASDEL